MPFAAVVGALGVAGTVAAGTALVGAGAAIYGASKASSAQNKATDAQAATARDQTQLGQEGLDFQKQQYDEGKAARDFELDNAQKVSTAQLSGMQFATDQAKKDVAYREGTFQPLEKGLVADASAYDTPQRRADAAAAAEADVDQSYAATNAASERDLARSGVAPGSGKAMSLRSDAAISQAASRAGAGTMAGRNVEQQGYARKMDAASLGRNLPGNQATQQQIASSTGTASTNAGMQAVTAQSAGIPNVTAGYDSAIRANNSAGNLYGSAADSYGRMASGYASGFGSAARAAGGSGMLDSAGNVISSWFSPTSFSTGSNPNGIDYSHEGANYPAPPPLADGGPVVRTEPTVGTKGAVRTSGAGPMSTAALMKALTAPAPKDEPDGIAALPADPLMNPKAIIEGRLKGYAAGGTVQPFNMEGGYGVDQFGPDFGASAPAPAAAPAMAPHSMSIQPLPPMGAGDGAMPGTMGGGTMPTGDGVPVDMRMRAAPVKPPSGMQSVAMGWGAGASPTRVDGVPQGVSAAPTSAQQAAAAVGWGAGPSPTRVDGVPQGALPAPTSALPPAVMPRRATIMPIGAGMRNMASPTQMPGPARPELPEATMGYAKGGAVKIGVETAPPVVPALKLVPKSMPRMGGTPAAPANRGSYQALPLSKGKAFAKGGMVSACHYAAGGAALDRTMGGMAVGGAPGTDTIPAYLDNGEHVMDEPTVTAIGGGNNAVGQAKLNVVRKQIKQRARKAA